MQYIALQFGIQGKPVAFVPLLRTCTSVVLQCRWSGILFMIAAILLAASQHVSMIVIGRVFQGIAVSPVCFQHTYLAASHVASVQSNMVQVKTD